MHETRTFDTNNCLLIILAQETPTGEIGQEVPCSNPSSLGTCPVKAIMIEPKLVDIEHGTGCAVIETSKRKDF